MKWTLYQAAREWNIDRQTLAKRLSEAGVTVGRGRKYHTREVTAAIVGRLESEKIRETKARANLLEIEQSEKSGRLVPVEAAKKIIAEVLDPIRSQLAAMPSALSLRCNPSDPELARTALEREIERILRNVSTGTVAG